MRWIAFFIALLCAFPAAAQTKCDKGTAKKPLVEGPVYTLSGPTGPVAPHRMASVKISCDSLIKLNGLVDASGKLLVPAIYNYVYPITPTMAAVQRKKFGGPPSWQMDEPYHYYIYGKGEQTAALPYRGFSEFVSGTMRYPYAYNSAPQKFDYSLFANASETPLLFSNLGGKAWRSSESVFTRHGELLIVNFTADDGTPVSRVLTLKGEPVSPVIGGVEVWETKPATHQYAYQENPWAKPISTEYLSAAYNIPHPDLPYGRIYVPIATNGTPLPLPAGMIGVFPLKTEAEGYGRRHTFGWALVYEHAAGFRIRWGLGSLESVIARAQTLPEVAGMQRLTDGMKLQNVLIHDLFALRSTTDGLWRLVRADSLTPDLLGVPAPAPSASTQTLYQQYIAARTVQQEGKERKMAEDNARAAQALAAMQAQRFQALIASGRICENPFQSSQAGKAAAEYVLRNCGNVDRYTADNARGLGIDPGLISMAVRGLEGRAMLAQVDAQREAVRAREWEAANAPINWNAWSDQAVKDMRSNTDNWIADQRRKYYDNLRAWNTGKNKTCC